jgi:hypothetical protein
MMNDAVSRVPALFHEVTAFACGWTIDLFAHPTAATIHVT